MTPEAKTALVNTGRVIRREIADGEQARLLAHSEASYRDRRKEELEARLCEIEVALASEGLALPPVIVTRAA